MKLSRKERRELARTTKTPFEPQYNGEGVITKQEYKLKNMRKVTTEVKGESLEETVDTETTTVE